MYRRFVDDTFSVVSSRGEALEFLQCLNSLHPSLRFTMEGEEDGRLPFLDVLVRKEEKGFSTAIYRKPTFTGLYTRWDSYCSTNQKISLIRSLTHRAKKICSPQHLKAETEKLLVLFEKNGYPTPIVRRVIQQTLDKPLAVESQKLEKVFIRLPWLGPTSAVLGNRILKVTKDVIPICKPICVFTTRKMFNTCKKDALPTNEISNVVYLFNCVCERSYVGKTSLRLEERIEQHVPANLVNAVTAVNNRVGRKCGRPKRACRETATTRVLRSRVVGQNECELEGNSDQVQSEMQMLKVSKSDSSITRHLKTSPECREGVCLDVSKRFRILSRARNAGHLSFLEALFISKLSPELCAQKEFVRSLELFS